MCLNPIKIRNNSRSFERGFSPLYREVPCGHCDECNSAVQNDWFVRLAYEWFENNDKGGTTLLITLTWNDANRPYLKVDNNVFEVLQRGLKRLCLEDEDVNNRRAEFEAKYKISAFEFRPFSHYHFDYKELSKFLKSLRQIFDYKNIHHYGSDTIKFFIASEYGHDKHLPHHHAVFFLPFKISSSDFMDCAKYAWSKSVKRCDCPEFIIKKIENKKSLKNGISNYSTPNGKKWQDWFIKKTGSHIYVKNLRGMLSYSKKYPAELCSVEGIKYVTKYVSKKDEYLLEKRWRVLSDYLHIFPRSLDGIKSRYAQCCDIVQTLRNYFPRVHSSNFLGISILREFECLTDEEIAKRFNTVSFPVIGVPRLYRVPAYIINRVMYKNDDFDNTLRVLTKTGLAVLKYRLELRVEEFQSELRNLQFKEFRLLTQNDLSYLEKTYNMQDFFTTIPPARNLAIYKFFFQNVEIPDTNFQCTDYKTAFDTFYYDYFDKKLSPVYDSQSVPCHLKLTAVRHRHRYCWNYQPCFFMYDKYLEYYNDVRTLVAKRKCEQRKLEYLDKQKYRKLYNEALYCPY